MRRSEFVGDWRITEMEVWDRAYLDLEVPAHIEFRSDRSGDVHFGVVRGWIDYRVVKRDGLNAVEFSWEGDSEGDPCCGRGWAHLRESRLEGRLFIHNGDDSSFLAERLPVRSGHRR